jgi:endonuclease YncB( thermonuclease family)
MKHNSKHNRWSLQGLQITSNAETLQDVYDGDTVSLLLPICCKQFIFNCRIDGIDAPETRTTNLKEKRVGKMVRDYVKTILEKGRFKIRCGKFDKYGRVLCDIILPSGENLGEHLIRKGYAYKYNGGPRKPFEKWYSGSNTPTKQGHLKSLYAKVKRKCAAVFKTRFS